MISLILTTTRATATLVLGGLAAGCAAQTTQGQQRTPPPKVAALLRSALRPESGQSLNIVVDSAPQLFQNVTFYRATRLPPFGRGLEDARPGSAGVVERGDSLVLVKAFEDLPRAWALARRLQITDTAEALRGVTDLMQLTGLFNAQQIVRTPSAAREAVRASTVENTAVIDSVREPSIEALDGNHVLRVYVETFGGLFEYRIRMLPDGSIASESVRLSKRWLGP